MIAYALGLTLLALTPASAQDGSWVGWHGCWRAVDDLSAARVVCLLPGQNAAEAVMTVVVNGAVTQRTTVRTDGQPHAVEEGGCRGTETGRWSQDRSRVFVRAELDCEGVKRISASVLAMVAENEWVDVQTITVHEQNVARVVRYRAFTGAGVPAEIAAALQDNRALAREASRLHASAPLDIPDVIEATTHLPAEGVQALLAARNSGFGLNAQKLVQLADARVPQPVIDIMVALSYPKTFVITDNEAMQRPSTATAAQRGNVGYSRYLGLGYNNCYNSYSRSSWYYSPFSRFDYDDDCYGAYRYGWGSRYGYGYNSGYGWNRGPLVIIVGRDELEEQPTSGRVVKGAGYTRGVGTTTGSARTRDTGSGSSSGTSSGGSATTSSGTSSGTGSTSTGRTAIPRGSGGGGGS